MGEYVHALGTSASENGTYVRLITPPAESRARFGEYAFCVGQKVSARLIKTDPYNGYINFACIGRYSYYF